MLVQSSSQQGAKIPGAGEENSNYEHESAIALFSPARHEPPHRAWGCLAEVWRWGSAALQEVLPKLTCVFQKKF